MRKILHFIFALGIFLPFTTGATSFIEQPLPETVSETPVLVRGKIGNSNTDWGVGPDGNKCLYTYYELQVQEVLKGQVPAGTLNVRELGGEKDGIGMQVAGAAHFERGEEVVLTLSERNPDGSYDLRGLSTGKYIVKQNESGTEVIVGAGAGGHFDSEHGVNSTGTAGQNSKPWTLDALRDLIRSQGASGRTVPISPDPNGKSSSFAPPPTSVAAPSQQAPQLQPSPTVEPEGASSEGSISFARALALALGVGVASWVWFARRRRR